MNRHLRARRTHILIALLALVTGLSGCSGLSSKTKAGAAASASASADPDLVWRDDMSGAVGVAPDATHWSYDTGGGGWGFQQLQTYTATRANVALTGAGQLRISAIKPATGTTFTSGRLTTRGKVDFTTGTLEARIKLPVRQGVMASFSLLSVDTVDVQAPKAGEIDVVQVGGDAHKVYTTLHGPKTGAPAKQWQVGTSFSQSAPVDGDFHTYAIQKSPGLLVFAIDDKVTATVKPADLPAGDAWVFDRPFYLVFDVSVGGTVLGAPAATTVFPADLFIDWITLSSKVQS